MSLLNIIPLATETAKQSIASASAKSQISMCVIYSVFYSAKVTLFDKQQTAHPLITPVETERKIKKAKAVAETEKRN